MCKIITFTSGLKYFILGIFFVQSIKSLETNEIYYNSSNRCLCLVIASDLRNIFRIFLHFGKKALGRIGVKETSITRKAPIETTNSHP